MLNRIRERFRNRDPLDVLLESPIGQQMAADEETKDDTTRRSQGAAIESAERERDEKLPAFDKKLAAKGAATEKARQAFVAADAEQRAAYAERDSFLHSIEHRVSQAGKVLREIAPPQIEAARGEVMARMERVRETGYVFETKVAGYSAWSGNPVETITETNHHTMGPWLGKAAAAFSQLDLLAGRYVPDYDAACGAILEELGERPAVEPPVANA
jgi:hypothetical protein